jgi:hypothetical protein
MQEFDDQIRIGPHDRDGRFVGRQGVEDLAELQRRDRFGGVSEHVGECCIGEQQGAVLRDREHGYWKSFKHHQRGQLVEERHR